MNANSVINYLGKQKTKILELTLYTIAAVLLIGHVFFLDGFVSASDVAMVSLGIVFGVMATFSWTPVQNLLNSPVKLELAETFILGKYQEKNLGNDTSDRRAA